MTHPVVRRAGLALAAAICLGGLPAARDAAAAGDPAIEALIAAKAPAVVAVKCVIKMVATVQGQKVLDRELPREFRGSLVDAGGLVMIGNEVLDGGINASQRAQLKAMGGEFSASATNLKVLFGNEAKEYEAVVVARDSNLGLSFVQIVDADVKAPAVTDLAQGGETGVGSPIFVVTRKPRGYDCAPVFQRLFVTGRVEKPRPMLAVTGGSGQTGLPAYDVSGSVLGVLAVQSGSEGVDGGASETFLLPLDTVRRAIDQVKKRVPEVLAKARASKEKEGAKDEPKETPKEPAMEDTPPAEPKPK